MAALAAWIGFIALINFAETRPGFDSRLSILSGALLALLLVALYFLPALVASMRGVHAQVGVILLDLLLGWTVIGWIAALIWGACGATTIEVKARELTIDGSLR